MTQGAIFNRVSDKNTNSDTYDITLSRFYSDLSEGQNTRLKVRGGMIGDFPLLDFKIPDEHYFVNIMNKFNITFINKKITYTSWSKKRGSPDSYSTLTTEMIKNILKSGTLFMRKILPNCNVPIEFILKTKIQQKEI